MHTKVRKDHTCFGGQGAVPSVWTLGVAGGEWIPGFAIISCDLHVSRLPGKGSAERHHLTSGCGQAHSLFVLLVSTLLSYPGRILPSAEG